MMSGLHGENYNRISLLKNKIEDNLAKKIKKLKFSSLTVSAVERSVASGGKRLRGIMTYIISKILNIPEKSSLDLACCIEFSHAFTLVHDDMIDKPEERRGHPPLFSEYGENIALLIGDMLFALSFECLYGESSKIFSKFLQNVIEGQVLDVLWMEGKIERSESLLLSIQELKTSSLFKISSIIPVLYKYGDSKSKIRKNLELFGHHFGFAFQILDDMKDLEEDRKRGSPNIVEFLGHHRALETFREHKSLSFRYLENFFDCVKKRTIFSELLKYLCIYTLDEENIQNFASHKGT